MNSTHSVTAAQLRSTRQPFKHFSADQDIITDDMTGTPLDSHHFALSVIEQNLD
jgi:hypothetical protein